MMTLRGPAMDWAAPRDVKPFWGFGSGRRMLILNKVDLGRIRAFYSWRVLDDPFQRLEDPIKHRSVRRPVCVFRWLGWYEASSVIGRRGHVAPWRNLGTGDGTS